MPAKDVDFSQMSDNNDNDSGNDDNKSDAQNEDDFSDFFDTLDRQVNRAVYDDGPISDNNDDAPQEGREDNSSDTDLPPKTVEGDDADKELDNLRKRYESSSEEAKRLAEERKVYEDFIPMLNAMRQDPGLVDHVKQYLLGNAPKQSIKDQLGLDEEFMFDFDEAISDPGSDSGKLFNHYVNAAVDRKIGQYQQVNERERSFNEQRRAFQEQHKLSPDEMEELESWAKTHTLTWEDIYDLKNRGTREKEIARRAIKEREDQLRKMRNTPRSLASTGDSNSDVDVDREVFKAIKRRTEGGDIFSNMK